MLNRIKSQSVTGLHCKYTDVASALASAPAAKRLSNVKDVYVSRNINVKNQLNGHHSNGLKSDTYESVCPPDDVVERTKQSHKNSVIRNHFEQNKCNGSCSNLHNCGNSNSTAPEASAHQSNGNSHHKNSTNLNRNLKRVSSAPPPPLAVPQTSNETGKKYTKAKSSLTLLAGISARLPSSF